MFKTLQLEDKEFFMDYIKEYSFKSYEYSFVALYMWRKKFNTKYDIINKSLVIKKERVLGESYFMQPLMKNKNYISSIVLKLKNMIQGEFLFCDIEENFLIDLKKEFGDNINYELQYGTFDYIYLTKELVELCGNKYSKKRNHCNCFIKNYDFEIVHVDNSTLIKDCLKFAEEWYKARINKTEDLRYELEGIRDVLANKEYLSVDVMALYIYGKIQGFSVGERINSEMAIIHIEKCNKKYKGIYAFINREFIRRYYRDTKYINREDDMGIRGLREAKLSYLPIRLEKKYKVKI